MATPSQPDTRIPNLARRRIVRLLVPLLTAGLLAWVPFLWGAIRRRSLPDAVLAALFFGAALSVFPFTGDGGHAFANVGLLLLAAGGAALAALRTPRTENVGPRPKTGAVWVTAVSAVACLGLLGALAPDDQPTRESGAALAASPSPTPTRTLTHSPTPTPSSEPPRSPSPSRSTHSAKPTATRPTTTKPPARAHSAPRTTAPAAPAATTAKSRTGTCSITSNAGNCYRAGQFCRNSDHGAVTTDAHGNRLKCAYSSGAWRWVHA